MSENSPSLVKDVIKKITIIFFTAIITAGVTYFFTTKMELKLQIREEKIQRYERLITYLKKGFLRSKLSPQDKTDFKNKYYEQTYVVWLFAPDDVIRELNQFAVAFSAYDKERTAENDKKVRAAVNRAVLAMRKDIHGKTTLKENEFITVTVE